MTTPQPPANTTDTDYAGTGKLAFCRRLGDDWRALAALLELRADQTRRFAAGDPPWELWDWLEQQRRLGELPQLLREIGRSDLADELNQRRQRDSAQWYQQRIQRWSGPRYALDSHFVCLNLLLDQGEDAEGPRWQSRDTDLQSVAEVLETLPDPAVVLLGEPGCGKSTLLRHHELDNARQVIDSGQDPAGAPLTFFISLSNYKPPMDGQSLPDPAEWLDAEWRRENPELPRLAELQRAARITLLLDALNEAPAKQADVVGRWKDYLADLQRTCRTARVVFSCRSLDYSATLSSNDLPVPQVRIKPLSDAQVREFLQRYAADHADALWRQLRGSRQLDLFRSAYYLKLLVELDQGDQLPEGRAALFTALLRGLLKREMEGDHPLFIDGGLLTQGDREQLIHARRWSSPWALPERGPLLRQLSVLAHAMQAERGKAEGGQIRLDYDQALALLDHPRAAELFQAGVALGVMEKDQDRYEVLYVHQLMQEWFAARHLARKPELARLAVAWRADQVSPSLDQTLAGLAGSDPLPPLATTGWEETARLAAAMADDPALFVDMLAKVNLPLAGRCAAQPDVKLGDARRDALRQALLQRSQHPEADLRARIAAARALGELGDPRLTVGTGPDGQDYLLPPLVDIQGGRYTLGSEDGHYDDETPVHSVELEGFQIATLAVTNAEWRLFMEAGGYDNERWWQGDEDKAWRRGEGTSDGPRQQLRDNRRNLFQQPGWIESYLQEGRTDPEQAKRMHELADMSDEEFEQQLKDWYPSGRQTEPRYWGDASYNHPSQPLVGICWYEARAYCAWLSHQCGRAVRLPTEAEWEAAARGTQGRRFPYGDEFDSARGNSFETHVRGTTPVGVFAGGATPEGLLDLSGNSWDWTSTLFRSYPYDAKDGREADSSGDGRRVVRGGSWSLGQVVARCACRNGYVPGGRDFVLGFRVLFPAPSSLTTDTRSLRTATGVSQRDRLRPASLSGSLHRSAV